MNWQFLPSDEKTKVYENNLKKYFILMFCFNTDRNIFELNPV